MGGLPARRQVCARCARRVSGMCRPARRAWRVHPSKAFRRRAASRLLLPAPLGPTTAVSDCCICCTVRGDLVRMLGDMNAKKAAGQLQFDRVIIETTGLADPAPVAQTFFVDEDIGRQYLLDAIVTMVDARHALQQLDEHHEAQEQVGFADRILITKTDLAAADVKRAPDGSGVR